MWLETLREVHKGKFYDVPKFVAEFTVADYTSDV